MPAIREKRRAKRFLRLRYRSERIRNLLTKRIACLEPRKLCVKGSKKHPNSQEWENKPIGLKGCLYYGKDTGSITEGICEQSKI